jgi:lysophospholipase L1-like esterase
VIWNQWRLVKNNELYNLESDPGQQTNVIAEHPETAQAMREHYENWWSTVQPFEYSRMHIGSASEPVSLLSSKDWAYGYCDDPGNLRRGTDAAGVWHLDVKAAGTYSIKLYRWPVESDLPITSGAPKFVGKYGWFEEGAALPVVQAKIQIAGQTQVRPIQTSDRSADFVVHLAAGPAELSSRFLLENGKPRCSAFYATITKTNDKDADFSHEPSDAKDITAMGESESEPDRSGLSPEQKAWELLLKKHSGKFYYTRYLAAKEAGEQSAWDYVKDDPALPRMLIIGDSISRGYTLPVRNALEGKVNVHRAPQNCCATTLGLENLDLWLGDEKWDLITFNFGIHDRNTSDADYEKNLTEIVGRLKATGARLVWVTTTPVPEGALEYVEGSVDRLNQIAASIMKEQQIDVLDLHGAVAPVIGQYQIHKNCHFKQEGYDFLGTRIAETARHELQDAPL